jgi:thiol-disulfide isomerase/thioredoxin
VNARPAQIVQQVGFPHVATAVAELEHLMYRLLVGSCVLALAVMAVRADDKKPEEVFQSMLQEASKEYRDAKSKEDKQKVLKAHADKFVAFAEKNSTNVGALRALVTVVSGMPLEDNSKDGPRAKALALLKKDHVKNKEIGRLLRQLAGAGHEEVTAFVKLVMDQHPDKKTQAKACQALQKASEQMAGMAKQLNDNEDLKGRLETLRGKEFVKNLLDNTDRHEKEAKEYAKLIEDRFADVIPNLSVGKKAPEVISQNLDGKEVKLSDLKGKVVVLDIWATWCGPCRAMIPHTRELVKKMDGKPFAFVSISADAEKKTVTEFIKKTPMPWTHWWNGDRGGIVEDWNVEYFPTIYVLDHKGVIRFKDLRGEKMEEAVEKLLKEMEDAKKSS